MFDIGWTELLVVGIVALIVIGPKELPEMFRTLGRFTAKMRGMARDFQRAMDSAADEAGVKDLKNVAGDLKKATSAKSLGLDAVKDAATKFEQWDPMKSAKPASPAATAKPVAQPDPSAPAPEKGGSANPAAAALATTTRGPATQALAEEQAARRESRKAAAAKLGEAKDSAAPTPEPAAARTRKAASASAAKPAASTKTPAKAVTKPAAAKAAAKAPAKTVAKTAAKPASPKPRAPRKSAAKGDAS